MQAGVSLLMDPLNIWKFRNSKLLTFTCSFTSVVFIYIMLCTNITSDQERKVILHQSSFKAKINLLDLPEFYYIINNNICTAKNIYLLILVHSAPNHTDHRNFIRSTWGRAGLIDSIKIVFLLGASNLQKQIEMENRLHHDIVQGNFVDSYRNLTYKNIMGMTWASEDCSNAKFILKMDDDIFMDIYQFLDYIKRHFTQLNLKNNIACFVHQNATVSRKPIYKWFISKDEYPFNTYLNYCSGWAYVTTPNVAKKLTIVADKIPYFWVDDVHITGTVAIAAGVGHIKMNALFDLEPDGLVAWSSSNKNIRWNKVFAPRAENFTISKIAHKKAFLCHLKNYEKDSS